MSDHPNPFSDVRFVVRGASRRLKLVVILLIVACGVSLITLGIIHGRIQHRTQELLDQAATLEHENQELAEKNELLSEGDSSIIEDIAREELGLADPDTVVFDPNSQ